MRRYFWLMILVTLWPASAPAQDLAINGLWDHAPLAVRAIDDRERLRRLGQILGGWTLDLAGVPVHGQVLVDLANVPSSEPLERAVREALGRPIKLDGLLLFLDDVLNSDRRGRPIVVTPGRARRVGLFVTPDEIFDGEAFTYPRGRSEMPVHPPKRPRRVRPAPNGSLLGPRWTARFPNPHGEDVLLEGLAKARPGSDYHVRVRSLMTQLRESGAQVWLSSAVRPQKRGYLIWGSFILSRAKSAAEVRDAVRLLIARNKQWGLHVPIKWFDPAGWEATRRRAQAMAETYDVVYATERGARQSDHYTGVAVDITAVGLPRKLTLRAPDGAQTTFDLTGVKETRDLSLSPQLIDWVEEHFGFEKLRADYPHWTDARTLDQVDP